MPRTAGQPPSPRHGCTMELLPDGRIVVFGGSAMGPKGPEYYSDVRELDTETMVWSRPRVTGDYPSGRYGHTSVMVGPYMLVYGGWCRQTKAQRAAATAAARGGGGGKGAGPDGDGGHRAGHLSWLNCETMEWTQPGCENKVPMARHGHSAIIAGPHVVMWGGWGGNRALAELHDCQVLVPGLAEELVVEDSQEDGGDGGAGEYVLPYADDLAPPSRDS